MRLDARLLDTASGKTIVPLEIVLPLHESDAKSELTEFVSRLAKSLRRQLTVGVVSATDLQLARAAIPSNAEAFRLYTEGLSKLREYVPMQPSSESMPPIKVARDLLEKASKIAANDALIHASLAEVLRQLGYQREAQDEIKIAFDNSAGLPREERLRIEASYLLPAARANLAAERSSYPVAKESTEAKAEQPSIYRTLFELFPENLEYGLSLARVQLDSTAMRDILAKLRAQPPPASEDPRIDLLEAAASPSLPEAEKLAARAASKANDLGARMTRADAKAREGHFALLAGELDLARRALLISRRTYSNLGNRIPLLGVLHDIYRVEWLGGASWAELDEELNAARRIAEELGGPAFFIDLSDRVNRAVWSGDLRHALLEKNRFEEGLSRLSGRSMSGLKNNLEAFVSGDLKEAALLVDMTLKSGVPASIDSRTVKTELLVEKGNILLAQGDFEAAQNALTEALESSEALGAKPLIGHAWVGLAGVAVEERQSSEAERLARDAVELFQKLRIALYEPAAHIALARALLAQDRREEARREIALAAEQARRLQLHREQLEAAILSERLNAASKKKGDVDKALRAFKKIISDAVDLKLRYQEFRARQAMAEIELAAGIRAGQADLAALKQDAGNAEFGLFTR
jgi:tetratricopeptide (TPR) repeat protein